MFSIKFYTIVVLRPCAYHSRVVWKTRMKSWACLNIEMAWKTRFQSNFNFKNELFSIWKVINPKFRNRRSLFQSLIPIVHKASFSRHCNNERVWCRYKNCTKKRNRYKAGFQTSLFLRFRVLDHNALNLLCMVPLMREKAHNLMNKRPFEEHWGIQMACLEIQCSTKRVNILWNRIFFKFEQYSV